MKKETKGTKSLRGYWTYCSPEAIGEWMKVPMLGKFAWIEEMIRLEAGLPKRIRELHRKFREGLI